MSITLVTMMIFIFQAEDGIRDHCVTGVQTCALPILRAKSVLWLDLRDVGAVQRIWHAFPGARGLLAGRWTKLLGADQGERRSDPQQSGPAHRERARWHAVSHVRQRYPGREGHRELRRGVARRWRDVDGAVRVLRICQPGLHLSFILLQYPR